MAATHPMPMPASTPGSAFSMAYAASHGLADRATANDANAEIDLDTGAVHLGLPPLRLPLSRAPTLTSDSLTVPLAVPPHAANNVGLRRHLTAAARLDVDVDADTDVNDSAHGALFGPDHGMEQPTDTTTTATSVPMLGVQPVPPHIVIPKEALSLVAAPVLSSSPSEVPHVMFPPDPIQPCTPVPRPSADTVGLRPRTADTATTATTSIAAVADAATPPGSTSVSETATTLTLMTTLMPAPVAVTTPTDITPVPIRPPTSYVPPSHTAPEPPMTPTHRRLPPPTTTFLPFADRLCYSHRLPLPENWRYKYNPDGQRYYYNLDTNCTTYDIAEVHVLGKATKRSTIIMRAKLNLGHDKRTAHAEGAAPAPDTSAAATVVAAAAGAAVQGSPRGGAHPASGIRINPSLMSLVNEDREASLPGALSSPAESTMSSSAHHVMAAAWPPHIAAVMLDFSNLGLGIDSAAMLTRMSPSEELDGFHIGRQDAGTPAAVASSTSTAAAAASPNPPATVSATSPEDGGRVPTPSATPTLSASSPTSPGAAAITGQAMIWDPYIQNMLTCISALNMAAKAAQKQGLEPLAITAVNAIYVILVATGTDRLDHPAVKSNAEIMTLFYSAQRHLNKLILATKIAAGVWPPPDAMAQLRFQIGQLLIFMQTFVSQCYTFRIQILPGPVEPARLFAEDGTLLVSDPGTFRLIPFFDVDFVPRLEHQSDAVMSCIAELVRIITPDITLDADLSAMSPQRSPQRSPQTSPKLSPQCSPQRFPHMVVRAVASPFSTPSGSPLLSRAVSSPAGLTAPRWDAGASAGGLPEVALRRTRELVVEMGRLLSLVENLGQHLIPDPGSRPSSQFMRHSDESALLSERDVTSMLGTDTPHEIYINFVTQRELLCNNISTLLTIAQSWQDGVMNTDDAMTQMLETTAEVLATMEDMLVATKMLLDQRCSLIQRHVTQSLMLSHVPLRNGTATTTVTITALPSPAASPLHDCSSTSSASSASATSHTMLSSSSLHAPLIHQRRLHRLTMKDLEALHLRAKSLSCLPTHSAASVDHDALVLSATNSDTPSLVPASSTASSIHSDATSVSDVCSRHHVHDADADASLPSPIAALTKPHHRHAYDAAMRLMRPAAAPAPVPAPAAAPVTPRSRLSSALHPLRTSTTVHAAVHHAAIAIHPGTLDPAQAHVRDHVLQRTASLNNDHRLSLMDRRSHALSADPLGIDVGAARTGKPARQDMKLARFFGARELDVSHFQRHKQKELARKFWFLGYDAPTTDISMNMEGQVRGGTLEALVERLTVHDQLVDPSYTNTFFLMMHQFTPSPGQVLRLLIGRYNLVCPAALTADEAAIWREQKLVPVRLRVYNALKIWLEHHWTVQDDAILPDLDHFIRTDVAQHQPLLVWRLLDLLERHQQAATRLMLAPDACALGACRSLKRAMVPPSTGARPAPILPKSMVRLHITDVDPLELARQLTLLESHLFLEISPDELIGQAWSQGSSRPAARRFPTAPPAARPGAAPSATAPSTAAFVTAMAGNTSTTSMTSTKTAATTPNATTFSLVATPYPSPTSPRKRLIDAMPPVAGGLLGGVDEPAPHVRAMTQMSNHMTGWITTSVLSEPDGKRRALMIRHFIKVGERLLALNNFNSLMAVISALNSSTVTRLVKTWNHVATKHRHAFQVLCHAMQNDKNYAAYRTRLRSTAAPCLPFLGLYLTDLTFTEDGNPDMRPGGRLINFDKYLKAGRIIQELQRFQVPYALQPVEALQAYLLDHLGTAVTSPQQLYSMSLAIEPRIPSGNENKLRSMAARARLLDTGKMTLLTVESTAAPLTPLGSMPMDAS